MRTGVGVSCSPAVSDGTREAACGRRVMRARHGSANSEVVSCTGCGYEYEGIEINLKSSLATAERRDALKALLLEMIEVDNADTKRRAVPDDPPVPEDTKGFATSVRQLGPATKKRQEHDEILTRRVEEMVQHRRTMACCSSSRINTSASASSTAMVAVRSTVRSKASSGTTTGPLTWLRARAGMCPNITAPRRWHAGAHVQDQED